MKLEPQKPQHFSHNAKLIQEYMYTGQPLPSTTTTEDRASIDTLSILADCIQLRPDTKA